MSCTHDKDCEGCELVMAGLKIEELEAEVAALKQTVEVLKSVQRDVKEHAEVWQEMADHDTGKGPIRLFDMPRIRYGEPTIYPGHSKGGG